MHCKALGNIDFYCLLLSLQKRAFSLPGGKDCQEAMPNSGLLADHRAYFWLSSHSGIQKQYAPNWVMMLPSEVLCSWNTEGAEGLAKGKGNSHRTIVSTVPQSPNLGGDGNSQEILGGSIWEQPLSIFPSFSRVASCSLECPNLISVSPCHQSP